MSRPISWLPRLHLLRRAVSSSARSHYDRQDIETLFELQPRAALKIVELLPSVQVGTSRLVDRNDLSRFLDRVHEAEDTAELLETIRRERKAAGKRKLHSLVRRNLEAVTLDSLPASMVLEPGRLELRFETIEELAESMLMLARVLECDGDRLEREFTSKAAARTATPV